MRIPDEGKYNDGSIRIEDVPGYQSCIHCVHCGLTRLEQIFADGSFFCDHYRIWKRGDDLFEYKCGGYRQKECSKCRIASKYKCKTYEELKAKGRDSKGKFCNNFTSKSNPNLKKAFTGRTRKLTDTASDYVVALEAEYAERKRETLIKEGIDVSSIRDIEFKGNISNINKSKELYKSWGGNKFPSKVKGIKSKAQLRKALNNFFEEHPIEKGEVPPLVNELAVYLGLGSERDLFRIIEDINPDRDMEVQAMISRAVGLLQNSMNDAIISIAVNKNDYKGLSDVLDRQDRLSERFAKKFAKEYASAPAASINISVDDKLKTLLDERLLVLNKAVKKPSAVDAEFEEAEEPQAEEVENVQ